MNINHQPHQPYPQPYYQTPPPAPKKRRWPWIVLGVLLAFVVIGVAANPNTTSTPVQSRAGQPAGAPANNAPPTPDGPATTMSGGMYQVGVDVQPGRYKTPGPPPDDMIGSCYWARHANDSGEFDALIANGNIQGPGSVTVQRGEFFEAVGGCTWTKVG